MKYSKLALSLVLFTSLGNEDFVAAAENTGNSDARNLRTGNSNNLKVGNQRRQLLGDINFPRGCYDVPANIVPYTTEEYDGWRSVNFCTSDSPCYHNDDGSSPAEDLQFAFNLYGDVHNHVYINNNGNLSFESSISQYSSQGFPNTFGAMVAPFWADVDTRDPEGETGYVWFKEVGSNTFAVTWDEVGYYPIRGDVENTFQVVISDGTNEDMGVGNNICFCYEIMEWTTGNASGGTNGYGGTPATVGANKGDGIDFFQLGRFDHEGTDYDGPGGINDGVQYLNHKSLCVDATGPNIPPVPSGFETIILNQCEDVAHTVSFSSPELDQTTTITNVVVPPVEGLTVTPSAPGSTVSAEISYTAPVNGEVSITITAQDNEGGETTSILVIQVFNCGGYVGGDPHFKTWSGELYDFHGICDLTLLQNPNFMNDMGMDIHVRSKKMMQFSHISTAVIRIGTETFEVAGHKDGDNYWLNGKEGPSNAMLKEGEMASFAGYPITFHQINRHHREYTIHISEEEKIIFSAWKEFVRVDIKNATPKNYRGSLGLMGSFDKRGSKLGRDEVTVFDDINEFGMEWQVLASEDKLFHDYEVENSGPQAPEMCIIPNQIALRRRLAESKFTVEEAEFACSHVKEEEERNLCVYDVMATNDKEVAGAY